MAPKEPCLRQWHNEMMIPQIMIPTITRLENQRTNQKLKGYEKEERKSSLMLEREKGEGG